MQASKRVAKNTLILYMRMVITVFVSLYSTRLILEALGASDFGIFNVVGGAITMLTFLNAAMASATQRFMSYAQGEGDEKRQKSIFNVSIILHFFIAIIVVLLLEGVGLFLFKGILQIEPDRIDVAKIIYQFLIISTFFTIMSVPYDAVINAHENMLFVAILGVVESIFKLGIAIYVTYTGFDKLESYGLLMAILTVLLLLIRRSYCVSKYQEVVIELRKHLDSRLIRNMTSFAGWSFLSSSSGMVANYGQGIVINMFFGTIVNAAQGIASQVSGQLSVFANVLLSALNPIIDKSEGAGNRQLMLKASIMGSKVSFFMLMFFYIPVLIEMPFLFKLWLKDVPEFAIIFCRLQLIRNLVEQLFITLGSSISAVGNIKHYKIYQSILNLFPLVFAYLLFLMEFPPYFMYIVFIFYALLMGFITLYFAKKNIGLSIIAFTNEVIVKCLIPFVFVFVLTSISVQFLNEGIFRLFVICTLSTVLFLLTVWLIGFNTEEKSSIREIITKKSK